MREDIASILLSEEQIHTRVRELGAEISRDYAGKEPLFVGVLKGCFIFMADLFREVTIHGSVDFMAVSSYGNGTSTTGAVKINKDLSQDIENRDVIIVEDILDSGISRNISRTASRAPSASQRCSISPRAAAPMCRRSTSASPCRTPLSSAMVWITRKSTVICRSSAFSSRKYTKNKSLIYILSAPSGGTAEKEVTVFEQPTLPQQDPSDRLSRIDLRAAARHDLFHDEKHRKGIAHLFGSHRAF